MRCAGYDRVDLAACEEHGIKVVRVPTYSPTSVAEHAVGLLFAVNRWAATAQLAVHQRTIRWPVHSGPAMIAARFCDRVRPLANGTSTVYGSQT